MKYTLGFRVYFTNLKMVIVMLAAMNAAEKHIVAYCLSDFGDFLSFKERYSATAFVVFAGSYWFVVLVYLSMFAQGEQERLDFGLFWMFADSYTETLCALGLLFTYNLISIDGKIETGFSIL